MTIQPAASVPAGVSRRSFLVQTSRAAAAGVILGSTGLVSPAQAADGGSGKKALVGSNVYGWTQYAVREKKGFDLNEVLSALRDAGYDYLENFMDSGNPDSVLKYAEQCRAKGMAPVSLYTGGRLHDDKAKQTIERLLKAAKACQQAGFQVISCNPDPIGREKTDEELKNQVAALRDLGQGIKELGLQLGIHHHLPEMQNKAREFHHVFRQTPADLVGFCYDVHWIWKGGIKPAAALQEYGSRVVTWHIRQSRNSVWIEDLDTGDVDYEAVAKYAEEHKLPRRFTVELAIEGGTKVTRSAAENHRRSREFIRKVFGA